MPDSHDAADQLNHAIDGISRRTVLQGIGGGAGIAAASGLVVADDDDGSTPDELSWGVERIGAPEAWDRGYTGKGVNIAIIGQGLDAGHDVFGGAFGDGFVVDGEECRSECDEDFSDPVIDDCIVEWDDDERTTRPEGNVSPQRTNSTIGGGLAAGRAVDGWIGVARGATVHAFKIETACTTDSDATATEQVAAFEAAVDRGYDIIMFDPFTLAEDDADVWDDALEMAVDEGVFVVTGSGDGGTCNDCVRYPAADFDETVVAVNAIENAETRFRSPNRGPQVDLAAPGREMLVPYPRNDWFEADRGSTWIAAAHVAGAAAILIEAGVTDPTEVRNRLMGGAEDIELLDCDQGAGLVNIPGALDADDPEPPFKNPICQDASEPGIECVTAAEDGDRVTVRWDVTDSDGDLTQIELELWTSDTDDVFLADEETIEIDGEQADGETTLEVGDTLGEPSRVDFAVEDVHFNRESERIWLSDDDADTCLTVETTEATGVETTEATLRGELTEVGDEAVDVGFEYGEAGSDLDASVDAGTLEAPAEFDEQVSDLDPDTEYEFQAVAMDEDGDTRGDIEQFSTDEGTDDESTPEIDRHDVSGRETGPWQRATSEWTVSDAAGALETVTSELLADGTVVDTETSNVSGSDAEGIHDDLRSRDGGESVRLVVTDENGNTETNVESL